MSSVEYLREFVNERLNVAAEEIFGFFKKTIFKYEEEIDRQRKLLDIVWKPEIKLHRIELPQQHVCKEEEVLTDQQLCIQERNSSLDQEDPEPPQIKEEQEELCTSQEGEQLEVKQETESFMLTPTNEESDHSEDQTPFNTDNTLSAGETESVVNIQVISTSVSIPKSDHQLISHNSHVAESQDQNPDKSQTAAQTELPARMCISWLKDESDCENPEVSEANSDHQFLFHNSHVADSQDQKGGKNGDSESTSNVEPKLEKRHSKSRSHTNNVSNSTMSTISFNSHTGKKSIECDTCGKAFQYKSHLQRHLITYTGEKPHSCKICGKSYGLKSVLKAHVKIHRAEKPLTRHNCKTCGKDFRLCDDLIAHIRTHTDEKPFLCKTCGMRFRYLLALKYHARTHTGEKPYSCETRGKRFSRTSTLKAHIRIHTGEKPHFCKTCGMRFGYVIALKYHARIHTDVKP